jgi:Kelch motif
MRTLVHLTTWRIGRHSTSRARCWSSLASLCLALALAAVVWVPSLRVTAAGGAGSSLAPMPTARGALAAVTGPDGKIYAIGGQDSTGPIVPGKVEAYDPATNSWSTEARNIRFSLCCRVLTIFSVLLSQSLCPPPFLTRAQSERRFSLCQVIDEDDVGNGGLTVDRSCFGIFVYALQAAAASRMPRPRRRL